MFRCFNSHLTWMNSWCRTGTPAMCSAHLLMVTQSFSSPCCEDTLSRAGQAPQADLLHLWATRTKGANPGCNSVRQEAGTGRSSCSVHCRSPQRSAHSDHLTQVQHWVANLRNLPWWHKKEPTLPCPHSGGRVQGVIYESQAFHACPTGVLPIRMCLEQDHPCMCTTHSLLPTAIWSLKVSFKHHRTQQGN